MESTISMMRGAIDSGYDECNQADVAFHDAVALASRNSPIQVCNQVLLGVVLSLIPDKNVRASNYKP